jgi:hypothetical protein
MKKIILYALAAVSIFLIVTNPSMDNFKEFVGGTPYEKKLINYRRVSNYWIFSVYQYSIDRSYDYIGIMSNFYPLKSK